MKEITLSKKDIIAINQKFAEGHFENESSLDYSLSLLKRNISWTKKLAHLIRSIIVDHAFTDGNKRSAYAVLLAYADLYSYKIEEKRAINIVKTIVLKNIKSIRKIERMIEDAITKK